MKLRAIALGAVMLAAFAAGLCWLARGLGASLAAGQLALALAGLLPLMLRITHLYDLLTLALWTASLGAMAHRRHALYLALFAAGCLNRETAALLVVVYVLQFGFTRLVLVQAVLYAGVRAMLMAVMAGRPGQLVEVHLAEHWPQMVDDIERVMLYLILAAIVAGLIARRFTSKPRLLRIAAIVTVPVLVVAYFVAGYPFEFRVFYEAYPAVALLALWPVKEGAEKLLQ